MWRSERRRRRRRGEDVRLRELPLLGGQDLRDLLHAAELGGLRLVAARGGDLLGGVDQRRRRRLLYRGVFGAVPVAQVRPQPLHFRRRQRDRRRQRLQLLTLLVGEVDVP